MITENQVIEAVCKHLRGEGWTITSSATTTQTGDDIEAERGGEQLRIEAKGGTSSKPESARHGQPFRRDQISSHVPKAFHRAAAMRATSLSGMALPDNSLHREFVEPIRHALKILDIKVYWVADDMSVTVD